MNAQCQSSADFFRPFVTQNIARSSPALVTEATDSDFDALIREATALLKDGPCSAPHLLRAWNDMAWNKVEDQRVSTDAESDRDGSSRITLYPSLLKKPRKLAVYLILKEFGHILYAKASEQVKRRWIYKLSLP